LASIKLLPNSYHLQQLRTMPGIFDPKAIYSKKYVEGIKHKQEQHRRNLANMKPTIVIKPPRKLPNCRNTRRQTEKEQKYAIIERENLQLLQKMSANLKISNIDNRHLPHVAQNQKFSKQLKDDARRREHRKIATENQLILHRLQGAVPAYDRFKWAEDAARHDHLLQILCEHPVLPGSVVPDEDDMKKKTSKINYEEAFKYTL